MALAPSLAPSPHPSNNNHCTCEDHTSTVEALVVLAAIAMFVLHVLGSLRRQSSNSLLHNMVKGVYTLSYPLVCYTIGRMQSSDWYYRDFAVWAVFLLLLLGSTDSLTACRLTDVDNWKSTSIQHLFKGSVLVFVVVDFGLKLDKPYKYTLSAILIVAILKWYVRIASMRMVSKAYICKKVKVIADYMQYKDNPLVPCDPVAMKGYSYLVAGEKYCINRPGCTPWYKDDGLKAKVVTAEQIWQFTGNLLLHERGNLLKDLCLSMALSKMLDRRFAGFNLLEAELDKTHDFVFKGLLVTGDKPHQRVFRVIEEELVFVHDMYYTRYSYLYHKGRYLVLCLPIIMCALCFLLIILIVKYHSLGDKSVGDCSKLITVVLAFLEAYQLYLYIASGWFKVALIRTYINRPFLHRSGCSLEMIIRLLLSFKAFRPWNYRLGQHCILGEAGHKNRCTSCLCCASKSNKGRKKSVKLSDNVKKAVVDSLLRSNGHLTNGVTSLRNNGVDGHLSWACHATAMEGSVTRTILVWHIATTLCKHGQDAQAKKDETVITATTLSQYCMHLLAFAPNLMPDHSSISESILDQSIEEAGELLKGCKKESWRDELIMRNSKQNSGGEETPLFVQGAQLARQIEDILEPTLRWKVLSDFWVEMMLYVSPSDDARAHLEALAKGGEFITHLWALLTHAGVLKRKQGPPGP